MSEFLLSNLTAVIAGCALIVALLTFILNRRKFSFDRTDFENKKPKFLLYLENSYKFQNPTLDEKYLLFNIRLTNQSLTKNSLLAKLRIAYFSDAEKKTELVLEHDPMLFHESFHNNLTKFSKEIRLEDKEIKSGWIIFKFPKNLGKKRIDYYELSVQDGSGKSSSVTCNLIKEIVYENGS